MSTTFTNAEALQDYIRDFKTALIGKLYNAFRTGQIVTNLGGVKDQIVMTEMIIGTIVQRWKKTFDPLDAVIDFKPRTGRVRPCKVDLQIHPQEFEANYLGMINKPGFNPDNFPYEAYIMDKIIAKVGDEQEIAGWQAIEAVSPADGDPLTSIFDGWRQIVTEEIAGGGLTATTTAAHTSSNAVGNAELVHAALAPEYQQSETYMFCSIAFARLYYQNYRASFTGNYGVQKQGVFEMVKLDFGNCWLVPVAGMGTSSRLICTPKENIIYLFDGANDTERIEVEKNHRALDIMIDFKMGVDFAIVHPNILAVNNLT